MTSPQLIAVAYYVGVDGFTKVNLKHLRNPEHPAVVWMQQATFTTLATHATREGDFYIPCRVGLTEPHELRALVKQKELPDDNHSAETPVS